MNEDGSLDELYQDILLEHTRSTRRRYRPVGTCSCAEAFNPLCGDEVAFFVHKDGDRVASASYVGQGCAISQASASMAAQALDGASVLGAREQLELALDWIKGDATRKPSMEDWEALGGVVKFPMRVKCATMPVRAALAALDAQEGDQIELGDET